jgi:hypothetical protein
MTRIQRGAYSQAGQGRNIPIYQTKFVGAAHSHRLLVDLCQDRCLARLGLGTRFVALTSAAHAGRVALIWPARAGCCRGMGRGSFRGLSCSK